MGNSRFYQFLFSKIPMLSYIEGSVIIGATGAVGTVSGNGVYAITRLTTGIYKIQLVDNYNALVGAQFLMESGITGSNVNDGSFVANTLYQITAVGTTNFTAIGLSAGLTAAVGQSFVATGIGGAGTGTAKAMTVSGITHVEVARNAQTELTTSVAGHGAIINIQTLAATSSSVTTLIPADPANGSLLRFNLFLRNSSNQY